MFIRVIFLCFILQLVRGDDIAQRLVDRYNDVSKKCVDENNNARPAYECSGLILRGVGRIGEPGSEQKYAWSKKSTNARRNAFSGSFLRKDQQFQTFAFNYASGFFYYPHLQIPSDKNTYPALCAYPIDAHSNMREGTGCGKTTTDITGKSGDCNAQGINTLEKWQEHYLDITNGTNGGFNNLSFKECCFDMTTENATNNFDIVLEAREYLEGVKPEFANVVNEIVIEAWDDADLAKFPIEAFFYVLDSSKGRDEAKMYQSDYLELTGLTIPVVGIRPPSSNNPNFTAVLDNKNHTASTKNKSTEKNQGANHS